MYRYYSFIGTIVANTVQVILLILNQSGLDFEAMRRYQVTT